MASWWLYSQNQTLTFNNMQLEVAIQQQEDAMDAMKESYEKQGESLNQMMSKNAQIEGTKDVFDTIENDSRELDSLDDPSGDINPNN